jgi:hypothetical protein
LLVQLKCHCCHWCSLWQPNHHCWQKPLVQLHCYILSFVSFTVPKKSSLLFTYHSFKSKSISFNKIATHISNAHFMCNWVWMTKTLCYAHVTHGALCVWSKGRKGVYKAESNAIRKVIVMNNDIHAFKSIMLCLNFKNKIFQILKFHPFRIFNEIVFAFQCE